MNSISKFRTGLTETDKFETIKPGWTIRVNQRIKEGEKTRVQAFEGMVISRKHGSEAGGTITVRKVSDNIGVEKTFPIYLPSIESVKVVRKAKVRRAKLYFLRDKTNKEIRKKIRTEQPKVITKVSKKKKAVEVAE
ncbi:MAG: 50S ribosomal protein L19 [Candidatus Yanofskybacteria bacterium RIFCSPHIGHO2_01_FULL_41_21]|uniref:50S ribosomal protein L19 n=1 Tax=Candidatus Yanofskybacteria bacterium RIFCSPHIGHO2_01_FULL_41_21 TaxID=1802660 RepID=A0A1F8E9Y0_9BACT|nr:MAG: 50S ribosomal protein L19 [Candidatus Yanofskybacteria bacterium RIFCSPHIGHO2_01_FULL_41_21]